MTWEYRTLLAENNYILRKGMNRLGKKGWEAYSVVRIDYTQGNADPSTFEMKVLPREVYIAYLKRPKRNPKKRNRHDNRTS